MNSNKILNKIQKMKLDFPTRAKMGEGGFIKEIIILVVALVILKHYFDFDFVGHVEGYVVKGVEWVKSKF